MSSSNLTSYERSSNAHKIEQENRIKKADTQEVLNFPIFFVIDSGSIGEETSTGSKQGYQDEWIYEGVEFCCALSTLQENIRTSHNMSQK